MEHQQEDPTLKASNDMLNNVDCSEYLASAASNYRAGDATAQNGEGPVDGSGGYNGGGYGPDGATTIPGHESNDLLYHLCIDQIGAEAASAAGSPTTYSCVPSLSNARGLLVPYEYDVHVLKAMSSDVWYDRYEQATAEVEGVMVEYLAEQLGLRECRTRRRLTRRSLLGGGQLRRREQEEEGEEYDEKFQSEDGSGGQPSALVGLSSEPYDMIDENSECKEQNLGVPSTCLHMMGSFAAYFERDTPQEIVDAETIKILRLIKQGMTDERFKTDAIPLSVYTGPLLGEDAGSSSGADDGAVEANVVDSVTKEGGPAEPDSDPPSSSSGLTMAAVGAGVAVFALLIVAVFLRRRRRRRAGRDDGAHRIEASSGLGDFSSDGVGGVEVIYGVHTVKKARQQDKPRSQATSTSDDGHGTCGEETMPTEQSGSYDLGEDVDFRVEVGTEKYFADGSGNAGGQPQSAALSPAPSVASTPSTIEAGNGTSDCADDESSVASEESGVTIELDMRRVNSTVSDITWVDPPSTGSSSSIISQFPPLRSMQYAPNVPSIHEVDSREYDDKDEDPLFLVGSVDHSNSNGGTGTTG